MADVYSAEKSSPPRGDRSYGSNGTSPSIKGKSYDTPSGEADAYKTWEKLKTEAKKRRDPWISAWQEIYDYTMPARESFIAGAPGEQRTDLIYDETAVQAIPKLASRLTAGYLPEYGEIFSLSYGMEAPDHLFNAAGEAKLKTLTAWIHESWQNSNLGIEAAEGMIDLAVGTMNLCQEPGKFPGDVVFTAVDPSGIAILPGAGGRVKGWFTWRKMALEDVFVTYPRARKSAILERDLRNDPRREVTLEAGTWNASDEGDEKWRFVCVLTDYKSVIHDQTFTGVGSCPWSCTRWSKVGRDVWGRGPIMLAMPAIKTCNITVQMVLENGEIALGGMWTYTDDGVLNPENITLQPGVFIPVSKEGSVNELKNSTRFDVSQLILADMRSNIKKALMVDELDTPGKTPWSAVEIQMRRADMARDLTAPGARITKECIVHHVNRTIWIFEQQGILDSIGLRVDGKKLRLTVKSPFLRGQDAVEMNDMMTGASQMNALLGEGTSGVAFRFDETLQTIAKRNGIAYRLLNSSDDIKAMGAQGGAVAGQAQAQGVVPPGSGVELMDSMTNMAKAGRQ